MNEPLEYCPLKSAITKVWRNPYTWVLASFVLGVLLMAAIGNDNDILKAMWFATGAAITAAATGYQTYQSNKRAADERDFAERLEVIKRNFETNHWAKDTTLKLRIEAYEHFSGCLSAVFEDMSSEEKADKLFHASARVRLVAPSDIATKSIDARAMALSAINEKPVDGQYVETQRFGAYVWEMLNLMRKDIGAGSICMNTETNDPPNPKSSSIPLQSIKSSGTSLHKTEAPAKGTTKESE